MQAVSAKSFPSHSRSTVQDLRQVGVGAAEAAAELGWPENACRRDWLFCEHARVATDAIVVRPAEERDRRALAELFAAVAAERDGIATEPPVDVDAWAAEWGLEGTVVAVTDDEIVGELRVQRSWFGYGEIGMMVAAGWRGRGVGSALVAAAIEWAREQGMHKLSLSVFPHNAAAIALYRKFGFVEEGRRIKHLRRANGELWDLIDMGLLL